MTNHYCDTMRGNAYFEVSQLLRRQPKHRAMIGLRFARDGDIRGHVHRAVTGADIAVLTHHGGCVRPRGWSPTEGTLTIFSAEARGHVRDICVLWQEINTEWLSLGPDYAPGAKTLLNIFLILDCKKLSKNLPIPLWYWFALIDRISPFWEFFRQLRMHERTLEKHKCTAELFHPIPHPIHLIFYLASHSRNCGLRSWSSRGWRYKLIIPAYNLQIQTSLYFT